MPYFSPPSSEQTKISSGKLTGVDLETETSKNLNEFFAKIKQLLSGEEVVSTRNTNMKFQIQPMFKEAFKRFLLTNSFIKLYLDNKVWSEFETLVNEN